MVISVSRSLVQYLEMEILGMRPNMLVKLKTPGLLLLRVTKQIIPFPNLPIHLVLGLEQPITKLKACGKTCLEIPCHTPIGRARVRMPSPTILGILTTSLKAIKTVHLPMLWILQHGETDIVNVLYHVISAKKVRQL